MKFPFELFQKKPLPWEGRPAIYTSLKQRVDIMTGETQFDSRLPDEDVYLSILFGKNKSDSEIVHFTHGATEGICVFHSTITKVHQDYGQKVFDALIKIKSLHDTEGILNFYQRITLSPHTPYRYIHMVFSLLDQYFSAASRKNSFSKELLHEMAIWLVCQAPDRDAVKVGLSLLGHCDQPEDFQLLNFFGLHEEFTLHVAMSLIDRLSFEEAMEPLWSLAKKVHGWGRIHLVTRLYQFDHPDLKKWFIQEGYKNNILADYVACDCAIYGEMKEILQQKTIEPELFKGAGEIIATLIRRAIEDKTETHFNSIFEYGGYTIAINEYVRHSLSRDDSIVGFEVIRAIKELLEGHQVWWRIPEKEEFDWSEEDISVLLTHCETLLKRFSSE